MPAENETQTTDTSSTTQAASEGQAGASTADPKAAEAAKADANGATTGDQTGKPAADPKASDAKAADPKAGEPAKPADKQPRISEKLNEIRAREAKLDQREAEWKGQATKYEAELKAMREQVAVLDSLKADPLALLKFAGYEGEDAAERFARDLVADPESRKVGRKVSELEKKLAAKEAAEKQAAEQRAYQETYARASANVKAELEKLGEDAEIARSRGDEAVQAVFEVADAYYAKHGKPLPVGQAVAAVAKHYEASFQKDLSTSRGKKLATPTPAPVAAPAAEAKTDPKAAAGSKTLGNATASNDPPTPKAPRSRIGRRSEREDLMADLRATYAPEGK